MYSTGDSCARARQRGSVALGDGACAGAACPVVGGGVGALLFPNLIRTRVDGEEDAQSRVVRAWEAVQSLASTTVTVITPGPPPSTNTSSTSPANASVPAADRAAGDAQGVPGGGGAEYFGPGVNADDEFAPDGPDAETLESSAAAREAPPMSFGSRVRATAAGALVRGDAKYTINCCFFLFLQCVQDSFNLNLFSSHR